MTNALILHPGDTVAVVTRAILKGEDVIYVSDGKEVAVRAADDIPAYHKIAVTGVKKGGDVLKYGAVIGYATADISAGNHVHTQNLSDLVNREGTSI